MNRFSICIRAVVKTRWTVCKLPLCMHTRVPLLPWRCLLHSIAHTSGAKWVNYPSLRTETGLFAWKLSAPYAPWMIPRAIDSLILASYWLALSFCSSDFALRAPPLVMMPIKITLICLPYFIWLLIKCKLLPIAPLFLLRMLIKDNIRFCH
jgi:hypothetical protein